MKPFTVYNYEKTEVVASTITQIIHKFNQNESFNDKPHPGIQKARNAQQDRYIWSFTYPISTMMAVQMSKSSMVVTVEPLEQFS